MSTQQDKFTEIADAIRSKLGITDKIKPNDFANKIGEIQVGGDTETAYNEGYTAGYDVGFEEGKAVSGDSWYDTFWDSFQDNGTRYHWNYAFGNQGWKDDIYNPKYRIGDKSKNYRIQYANNMFQNSQIKDTKHYLDFSRLSSQAQGVFDYCRNLITIQTLTVAEINTYSNWFRNCVALENITFEGVIGQNISFADSPLLSQDSVKNIISHLKNYNEEGVTKPTETPSLTLYNNFQISDAIAINVTLKGWNLVK